MNAVEPELASAVDDVFYALGDEPNCTVRKYSRGTTPGSTRSGQQGRKPVGAPIVAQGILSWRRGEAGVADVFLKPSSVGDASLTQPDLDYTIQFDGQAELDISRSREGGQAWSPMGPAVDPALWKAVVVEGGPHDAGL